MANWYVYDVGLIYSIALIRAFNLNGNYVNAFSLKINESCDGTNT